MNRRVSGTFDVVATQEAVHSGAEGAGLGRMSLDQRYQGALDATGTGERLTAMTATPGSAGHVALEKVDGTLGGRAGTF